MEQRLRTRVGEAFRGNSANFRLAVKKASSVVFGFFKISFKARRRAANFATSSLRLSFRLITEVFAITLSSKHFSF
jgi:hypothetical protein